MYQKKNKKVETRKPLKKQRRFRKSIRVGQNLKEDKMSQIYHRNGGLAWNGHQAYHDNGGLAWNGHQAYHDNGGLAWNGHQAYHSNGGFAGNEGIEVETGNGIRMMVGQSGFRLYVLGNCDAS